MPKGATEALLQAFANVCDTAGACSESAKHLDVSDFDHNGVQVRGLASTAAIKQGTSIMAMPEGLRVTDNDMQAERFAPFEDDDYDYFANALWLAEKKAEYVDDDHSAVSASADPVHLYWKNWFRSLPTLEEYKNEGMPIAAPDAELARLKGLPHLGTIESTCTRKRANVQRALDFYNAHRGDHKELTFDDVLWGYTVVTTRSFLCHGTTMAPVGDLLAHGTTGNVAFKCKRNGQLDFVTTKDVKAGEELVTSYHDHQSAENMLMQYGMMDGADFVRWPSSDCRKVRAALLDASKSGFMQNITKLIDGSCPAPPATAEAAAPVLPTQANVALASTFGGNVGASSLFTLLACGKAADASAKASHKRCCNSGRNTGAKRCGNSRSRTGDAFL
eukprot:TRINITY_DN65954_c0_g1_i1.p1 TRINITY_DN65954_c0_g1~~TRINITY_DN65954_c0_g1_i1.p1  ORF type:complete len:403 (-),score=74.24 TRINITY_DN65954_c0_g1_i1:90-1259(-)